MPNNFLFLVFVVIFVWLIALSVFFWRIIQHYNNLTHGVSQKTLKTVLEEVLKQVDLHKKDIDYLKDYSLKLEKEGLLHIQKVGLVRFNPFKDTGGDQSFILSLIDGNNTGVIISGLYSRSGTRWYAKKVSEGKAVEHELSEEEKKALREAK
jgi:Flp pilus assembly protein TadB